jgi:membrane protease YdiL (CAAX protease family)
MDRYGATRALRKRRWPPAVWCSGRKRVLRQRRLGLSGPDLGGVRYDGHNRREGGRTPLAASVRAVAGRPAVVPGRSYRPPAIILLATIVLPGALASFRTLAPLDPLLLLVSFPLVLVFGGALFEEGGWRGFALPRLQWLHGPFFGTLILGALWACWHLPLFWITVWGTPPTVLNMVLYVPAEAFMTVVFTWVFNNTKGSVLVAILLHASFDVLVGPLGVLFPAPVVTGYGGAVPMLIGLGVTALLVVALTRGRLGYRNYRQEIRIRPRPQPE